MAHLDRLTTAQRARIPEWVERWTQIGLCCEPAARVAAEAGIDQCYRLSGLRVPRVYVWTQNPLVTVLAGPLASLVLKRLECTGVDAIRNVIERTVGEAVGGAVVGVVGTAVERAVWRAVEGPVGYAVMGAVRNAIERGVLGGVMGGVWGGVEPAVGSAVVGAVGRPVWGAVEDMVESAVERAVGAAGAAVMGAVRNVIERRVGEAVGGGVGGAIGGAGEQPVVGAIRNAVEGAVGGASGDAAAVDQILDKWSFYTGGQFWVSWAAHTSFFDKVCGLVHPKLAEARAYEDALSHCGWWWPHTDFCIVTERPRAIHLSNGRLHADGRMAVEYEGWGVWALHGVLVPRWLAETPAEKIDPRRITEIENAEIRREFVRKVGVERLCQKLHATVLDIQGDYSLLQLDIGDGRKREYLKMLNPSIGTWHVEGVPPGTRTVAAGLAFRNGTTEVPVVLT